MLEPGQQLERFRVSAVLGEGGVAVVYKVVHEQLGSVHALKVLQVASESTKRRLLREGRAQAAVHHPNLVSVTDVIEIAGRPALVMEFIDGPTLEQWLAEHRPSRSDALRLFHGIVLGAQALHEAGFVHRDLKPANVLLARGTGDRWRPRLTDFGLVKEITRTDSGDVSDHGLGLGTPQYMAPEQLQELADLDQRADLFSLGCILYELVTGIRAFQSRDLVQVATDVCTGRYVPPREIVPDLPLSVVVTIDRLLQPDRTKRLRSCAELLQLLYGGAGDEGVPSLPTLTFDESGPHTRAREALASGAAVSTLQTARPRMARPSSRPRVAPGWWLAGMLLLVVLSAGLGYGIGQLDELGTEAAMAPPTPGAVVVPAPAPPVRAPVVPAPEPVVAPPPAAPAPVVAPVAAAPEVATVTVDGDALVVLVRGDDRLEPGTVPVGSYQLEARFGQAAPVVVGELELAAGDHARVKCSSFVMRCQITR